MRAVRTSDVDIAIDRRGEYAKDKKAKQEAKGQ